MEYRFEKKKFRRTLGYFLLNKPPKLTYILIPLLFLGWLAGRMVEPNEWVAYYYTESTSTNNSNFKTY